jgi:mannan endo-1,4-beta-mannosidase
VLEAQIGRTFDLSVHYDSWASTFPSAEELDDRTHGRTPEVSWGCGVTDATVASGGADAVVAAKAQQMAAFGAPILLRYKWEFNLPDTVNNRSVCADPSIDQNGYFDPATFVAAWIHIHDVFVAAGASNVSFDWNPSSGKLDAAPYWPGDAYVDRIGIDVYDLGGGTLANTLAAPYAEYVSVGTLPHPIVIGETGAVGNQASYLDGSSRAILAKQFPMIEAICYFDAAGPRADWSFTPQGLASFTIFANQ